MPPKKSKSTSNEMALKDISSNELSITLLSALENDNVITKLATVLSTSMNLLLDEKMTPILIRLNTIASEMKTMHTRMLNLEQNNSNYSIKLDRSSNKRWRTLLGYEMDVFSSNGQSIRDPCKY